MQIENPNYYSVTAINCASELISKYSEFAMGSDIHWGLVIGTVPITRPPFCDSLSVQNLSVHASLSVQVY